MEPNIHKTVVAGEYKKEENYWLDKLSGDLVKSCFPYDYHPRPVGDRGNRADIFKYKFSDEVFTRLLHHSYASDVKLYMMLVAGLVLLKGKYTGNTDIVVGAPIYRQAKEEDFINTILILRNELNEDLTFKELLLGVRKTIVEAAENVNYPLEVLLDKLNMKASEFDFPLFDTAILLENIHDIKYLQPLNVNLIFSFLRTDEHIECTVKYNPRLFKGSTVERVVGHFDYLLHHVLFKPGLRILETSLLTGEERQKLLVDFNDTAAGYPADKTIHDIFAEQVMNTPDHTALVFADKCLTYRRLEQEARRLADYLSAKGHIRPEDQVGILMDKCPDLIIAILAVLKSGAAYVPLGVASPQERLRYIVNDVGMRILISQEKYTGVLEKLREECPSFDRLLCMDSDGTGVYEGEDEEEEELSGSGKPFLRARPGNLAYIIYTSGTSGVPKGVMIEHRNVVRLMLNDRFLFDFGKDDTWTMFHSPGFDFSVWEMYGALLYGGKLVLIPQAVSRDTAVFLGILKAEKVNVLNQTPSAFYNLAAEELQSAGKELRLKYVVFGGEALNPGKLKSWHGKYPAVKLINMFGITETTVHVTYKEIGSDEIDHNISNIGRPLPTTGVYIHDEYLNVQPIGVTGELAVGGDGVSRGYVNQPELAAEKFVENRYRQGDRVYRSGDLAKFHEDGEMEYLGRVDQQIQLRGFRIEPAEIESHLLKIPGITDAVVVNRLDAHENNYLCAYIVLDKKQDNIPAGDFSEIRETLGSKVPDYMIPSYFVVMESIPLKPNGKIDSQALPAPQVTAGDRYVAPRDEVEQELAGIWAELLDVDRDSLSIDANFFEIGGHSLIATTVVSHIRRKLAVEIALVDFFQKPTIRHLSETIRDADVKKYFAVLPVEEREYYDLSHAQKRLWLVCHLEENFSIYNEPSAVVLVGMFDVNLFERALQVVLNRHEILRTVYLILDGVPKQKILKESKAVVEKIDLRHLKIEDREMRAREIYKNTAEEPFDFKNGPLFVFKAVRLEDDRILFILNMHHMVMDGWSSGIMFNELMAAYNSLLNGERPRLKPVGYQYKDYSQWQNSFIKRGFLNESADYWLDKFGDKPKGIELPFDYQRGSKRTFNGNRLSFFIEGERLSQLIDIARQEGGTIFMMLLTLFSIVLHKYSGEDDIIIGSPIANRKQAELKDLIGFVANTIVFRNRLKRGAHFPDIFRDIKEEAAACYENQDYPFNLLIERLRLERTAAHSPLYNVMFGHVNTATLDRDLALKGTRIERYKHIDYYNLSIFDLILVTRDFGSKISAQIEYNSDLFKQGTIERVIANFEHLIDEIIRDRHTPLSAVNFLTRQEYNKITRDFNGEECTFPGPTVQGLFEDRVEISTDKVAVVFNDRAISYGQLNNRINCLARYLREENHIKTNDIVGISVDRSIGMIVTIWGIIKSGAGYVAVDPNYPEERVQHILKDSGVGLLVIDRQRDVFNDYKGECIHLDADWEKISRESTKNPEILNEPDDLLYVIYTSGSTGTPNGAKLSHDLLANLIQWQAKYTAIDSSGHCLQFTSVNFCVSFQEIVATLTSGGTVYLIGDIERQDINYLMDFLSRRSIEILYLPFSYLNFLFNESNRWHESFNHSLKHIITAGEQLKITGGIRTFLESNPGIKLHNHYGSSEMHVVTSYTMDYSTAAEVSIPPAGQPIANTRIYILDDDLKPVPIGVWGELFVESRRELLRYVNNRGLLHKFVRVPELSAKRLYRSGDVGRWFEDGNIELRGRKDFQVKIRGFRVEPGEVESKILSINGVKESVVVVRQDDKNQKSLLAYVVADGIEIIEIKKILSGYLPQYMIPEIVKLNKLPLMPNGKVDRERLPEPDVLGDYRNPIDTRLISQLLRDRESIAGILRDNQISSGRVSMEKTIACYAWLLRQSMSVETLDISGLDYNAWPEEKILRLLAETTADPTQPLQQVFEQQVERTPDRTAIAGEGGPLTYRELNDRSNRLARLCRSRGVGPGTVVGIMTAPSLAMVSGILAVLKAGGAYLLAPPHFSQNEVMSVLKKNRVSLVLSHSWDFDRYSFTKLQDLAAGNSNVQRTGTRKPEQDLDALPLPDRSLVDYEKYARHIGITMVKSCITILSSRGCPYNCAYCHRIWPKKQVCRSAENIFAEVKLYYDMGIRRFAFIDDIFNLNVENGSRFFELILAHGLDVQFFFSGGLRGDILTPTFIDLMVKAGTVNIAVALESASSRLQKLMGKGLNVDRLRENLRYICKNHPQVILELHTMHGFPTETEEEARETLAFIKSIEWLDFPYIHLVRIYPNTRMEQLAIENGVSREAIVDSEHVAFHEWTPTIPFAKSFTSNYQAEFLNDYFLSTERLLKVLPRQMRVLTEEDMVQKYHSYLSVDIKSLDDLLRFVGLSRDDLSFPEATGSPLDEALCVPDLNLKMRNCFPAARPDKQALRLLLLDLSQFFRADGMLYDVVESPLGLISLLTYLNRSLAGKINGKIAKARIDFDSFRQLKALLEDFRPDVIGVRCLTFYKDFFHQAIAMIRHWGFELPIIAGGPYATSDYNTILQDANIDLVVLGEGEVTFLELLEKMIENRGKLPKDSILEKIPGLAFVPVGDKSAEANSRQLLMLDQLPELAGGSGENLEPINRSSDPAQVILSAGADGADLVATHHSIHSLLSRLEVNDVPPTSFLFDGTPPQVFGPLLKGGSLYIVPPGMRAANIQLLEFYRSGGKEAAAAVNIRLLVKKHLAGLPTTDDTYVPPGSELERRLVKIWSEILDIEEEAIGIDANFFEIGGHSLRATILASRIHREFNVKFPLIEIFGAATVREIADLIGTKKSDLFRQVELAEKREYYKLSSAQRRVYFLQEMDSNSVAYNMPLVLPLDKDTDKEKLEWTIKELIERHESLRTSFEKVDNVPVQRIHPRVDFKIDYLQAVHKPAKEIIESHIRPFDLSQAPLLRSALIGLPGHDHIWIVDMHHIISDGTSKTVLTEDFMSAYNGRELAPLKLQYRDFSEWQNHLVEKGLIKDQEAYWLNLYADEIPRLNMPIDFKRPAVFTFKGDCRGFVLKEEEVGKFKEIGARNQATLYMNILAVLNVLFHKYTGQTDMIIGCGIAGRRHIDLQNTMGMFVNTLAMRNYPSADKSYEAFLAEVTAFSLEAFENQDVQFEALIDMLNIERDPSRNPLFDVLMVVQNFRKVGEGSSSREPGRFDVLPIINERLPKPDYKLSATKFDLTFLIYERDGDILVNIEYYSGLFKEETIRRLITHLHNIIKAVINNPLAKLKNIEMMTGEEKSRLLYQFNDTVRDYPRDKTIHQLFADQARRTPANVALEHEDVYLTYAELDQEANRLACFLADHLNIRLEQRVGILLDRSIHMIIAIVGILKAGGAYVPLETSLPEKRLKNLIDDAELRITVSASRYIRSLNRLQWECECFESFICVDSADVYAEAEVEKSALMDIELWHHVGETAVDDITGGGWISSYTGEPFSRQEMDEYSQNILAKLKPVLNRDMRVLEIGCASGLSMYKIAPLVKSYHGTDLSGLIIEKNRARLEAENIANIKLDCLAAHEIDQLAEKNFDLVIMNSVIQSFHGHNYLRQVFGKVISVLNERGYIFVGDVMDQDRKEALTREMVEFKSKNRAKNYKTKTDWSNELFVSRRFFTDLSLNRPEITDIAFSDKIFTLENELTKFRYDALFTVDRRGEGRRLPTRKSKYQFDSRILRSLSGDTLQRDMSPANLAYIIYTSGSTGKPKGVMVEHGSVVNLAIYQKSMFNIGEDDRTLLFSSISFDASVEQIWITLLSGAALVLVGRGKLLDREGFEDYLVDKRVTHLHAVPAFLNNMGIKNRGRLRRVIAGGDVCPLDLARHWYRLCDFYNEYGPTETTVTAIESPVKEVDTRQSTLPIGKPLGNTTVHILDRFHNIVPTGITGELYIGGDCLARGYLNDVELTGDRFIPAPYGDNGRLYRTGDLGRWLLDGNIEFQGRTDNQVKIRGYRVEPGEIEYHLLNYGRELPLRADSAPTVGAIAADAAVRCRRCLLPGNYPGIGFDQDGTCHFCRKFDQYEREALGYFKGADDFLHLMAEAGQVKQAKYDCMLLYSGGKDSTYVLYRLVDMGFKVLTFTFDNGYISATAFKNIDRITSALGVENIVGRTGNMDDIFAESLVQDHSVCTGCFRALTTVSTKVAYERGINVIVTGLSRGQIFDTKLQEFFDRSIFAVEEIEKKLLLFRKAYHARGDRIGDLLNVELADEVFGQTYFVDFFRYDDISTAEIRQYLAKRDKYWSQPEDTGFCSSNCLINDVGIYIHLKESGYHNYAAPLSWDIRLGKNNRDDAFKQIRFSPDLPRIKGILEGIGYSADIIKEAAVIDRQEPDGNKTLVAYIVAHRNIAAADLREYLARRLPEYMVPSFFVRLDSIPLTVNGKVNRKALPEPGVEEKGEGIATPRNEIERQLLNIWSEVLDIDKHSISVHSNFFELGGHSLRATILSSKIHKVLAVKIPLAEIFKSQTIREMALYVKEAEEDKHIAMRPVEKKEYYPLSPVQKRLFFLQQLNPGNTSYNMPYVVPLAGDIDVERVEYSFRQLMRRHESLRTSFHTPAEEPVQKIAEAVKFALEYIPVNSTTDVDPAYADMIEDYIRPFDLSQAPLMRVHLIESGKNKILIVDQHHIVSDGISQQVLKEDFYGIYEGKELPPLKLQYKDYSEWQGSEGYRAKINSQESYWLNEFYGELPVLSLPYDFSRPTVQGFKGKTVAFILGAAQTGRIKAIVKNTDSTLFMFILSVFNILLSRLSEQEDIIIGLPIAGRRHVDLQRIIGMFVNTLAVRSYPAGSKSFREFLNEVKNNTLEAFENQEYQFEELVDRISPIREPGRNPIFDVVFTFLNQDEYEGELEGEGSGEAAEPLHLKGTAKFDMALRGADFGRNISLNLEYSTDLFEEDTIDKFIEYFKFTVDCVIDDINIKISEIELVETISAEERSQLFCDIYEDLEREVTL
jgi:amino acid adenylation domain-containing protein